MQGECLMRRPSLNWSEENFKMCGQACKSTTIGWELETVCPDGGLEGKEKKRKKKLINYLIFWPSNELYWKMFLKSPRMCRNAWIFKENRGKNMRWLLSTSKININRELSHSAFLGSVMNTIYIDTATTIKIFIWKLRHNLFGRRE